MSERLTLIVGEYTISQLRSGEAVEFDNGVTILPASDLATNDPLRAHVAKLEAALRSIWEQDDDAMGRIARAVLKDAAQ